MPNELIAVCRFINKVINCTKSANVAPPSLTQSNQNQALKKTISLIYPQISSFGQEFFDCHQVPPVGLDPFPFKFIWKKKSVLKHRTRVNVFRLFRTPQFAYLGGGRSIVDSADQLRLAALVCFPSAVAFVHQPASCDPRPSPPGGTRIS